MEQKFCQSCGMPMGETTELYGCEADGSKSKDYCSYCYDNGEFKSNMTMEEMIELCVPVIVEEGTMDAQGARTMMQAFFPTLKRWK